MMSLLHASIAIMLLSRYQAMVHCGSIRQTASIVHMSADCLRTGDKASVHFKFVKHPEFLKVSPLVCSKLPIIN